MARKIKPPVNLSEWMQQVEDDPYILSDFKNGPEGQLEVSSMTFKSGSVISSTEYLYLHVIWHKYIRLESLGHLMKDDPRVPFAGYVSADNIHKANLIFNTKRPLWQPYLKELKLQAAAEEEEDLAAIWTSQPPELQGMKVPQQYLRPSMDGGNFLWWALYSQLLVITTTDKKKPTTAEVDLACAVTKPGVGPSEVRVPLAVNQPVSPMQTKLPSQPAQHEAISLAAIQPTPPTKSFLPASGGKFNKPAADECYVNTALLIFLQSITVMIGGEFSSLDWLGARIPFKLTDCTTSTEVTETGESRVVQKVKDLLEARVDGYLCQRPSPYEKELNTDALAIMEVKPFRLKAALSATRRQEGAEMACWVSEAGNSTTGLLQASTSGRKRRLMISQHRHEIFVIVAEYGAGYEEHIGKSGSGGQASSKKPGPEAEKPSGGSSITEPSTGDRNSAADPYATPKRRNPKLLAGSPSYIKRVESLSTEVAASASLRDRGIQPIRPAPGMSEWAGEEQKWVPDVGDFLIMHEFGPFLTTDPGHMELFIKRLIALMLQLKDPNDGFVPETTSSRFLFQPGLSLPSSLIEPSSPRRTLQKSRSWPGTTKESNPDWEEPSEKPIWQG